MNKDVLLVAFYNNKAMGAKYLASALEKNGYVFCAATGLYKLAMHQLSRSLDRLA